MLIVCLLILLIAPFLPILIGEEINIRTRDKKHTGEFYIQEIHYDVDGGGISYMVRQRGCAGSADGDGLIFNNVHWTRKSAEDALAKIFIKERLK